LHPEILTISICLVVMFSSLVKVVLLAILFNVAASEPKLRPSEI
jgi:hypothetical protein